ncbi:uncharacterized protein [Solanum lycopersicum]|uniref:uncharacterized protein n=1 Tax=Solanum lycopersicum TaxID=4081 RepID=UPI003749C471
MQLRVVSEKAKFEMLMSTIFQENACSNIVPTAEEIEAFDIAQVEHAHSTSIPLVQPNEEDDLDNFSTKPPEQLFRTYSRVSDTSPPPLPKRRKKLIIQKKKVSEQNQPDQSNVSPTSDDDVHVSMSSLPQHSNADDVHGSVPQVSPNRLLMHMVLFQTLLRTRLLMFMDMQIHRMSTIKFLILKS